MAGWIFPGLSSTLGASPGNNGDLMTTFQEARAFLLKHRADYDTAVKGFRWPDPVPFNWALDWFDAELAANGDSRDRTALWIVDPGDKETKLSFAALSRRSNQVANFLRAQGLRRSDPVGALSTMFWLGLQPGDVHLNISSPGWAKHAWSCFFAPWNAGATVFVVNQPRFDAKALLATVGRCGVTTLCAPPTVWRLFIQEKLADFRVSLREVCGAGEPLNPEVIDQVKAAWGLTIRDGYGQPETTALAGNSPGQKVKAGSMGRPLPGYRVQITDNDGHVTKEGEVTLVLGESRPAGLMRGCQGDDGQLSGADGERYRSGDVVFADDDGYLTFVGRSDDVFKSSDYRISPFELESILLEHVSVVEAAVVPTPDPIRLAIPKAYVLLA